jgi:hypothetical protein
VWQEKTFNKMLIAIVASLLSALVAALVSIFMTRYTLKHGPNYSEQIRGLHDTIQSLAKTQEDLRKQQAEQAKREEERHGAELRRLEAANWKPQAEIISVNEGLEHVNKLSIVSLHKFRVIDVTLLSETGAKVHDILKNDPTGEAVVGKNIKIPHTALNQLASRSPTYFQLGKFEGAVRFTVERAEGEKALYTGEIKFTAENMMLGSTKWYHLVG